MSFLLPVAFHAKAHLKINALKSVLAFDIAVTLRTIDLIPAHVRPMMEEDIIRRKEDPDPGNRFFRNKMVPFLHDLRMLRDDVLVAEETFLHRRKSRILRTLHKRMAETAIDSFDSRMNPVAKWDRLLWPDHPVRVSEHVVRHQGKQKGCEKKPQIFLLPSNLARSGFRFIG